ncbi:mitochondrial fission ELM1 family protein [Benzoatithermus flavus]|uniref:Mitochondrial fission ELM1 family protein n=1 Tax=Benzoatithermus flavus TaxID=3108223 RepID=A0ABU8XLI1_9PROT
MDASVRDRREPAALRSETPRTWLLLGHKQGDNGQVLALAEALGWPFEIKRIVYRPWELVTNRLVGVTLLGIDRRRSSPLEPPWPELVITAGRRNEPVARWIQARAGGRGRVRLVHVGRPWASTDVFDLIVTTPQYALPGRPNILHNEAPMHRVAPERLVAEGAKWAPRLVHLPRPWTAVLLGGHIPPYTFDREAGTALGRLLAATARRDGGSLLISTSARTPAKVVDALAAELDVPHLLYRWRRDDPDNPYFGFLALAERIVVTSDSMSMLIEAVASGKPVFIFDLATGPGSMRPATDRDERPPTRRRLRQTLSLRSIAFHLGRWLGPRQLLRDVGAIHRAQVAAGRAVWLGQPWPETRRVEPLEDTQRAADRVRALFRRP